jgi:hypothetical protein
VVSKARCTEAKPSKSIVAIAIEIRHPKRDAGVSGCSRSRTSPKTACSRSSTARSSPVRDCRPTAGRRTGTFRPRLRARADDHAPAERFCSDLLAGVHRVASLLQRWLLGTHLRAVSAPHT